MFHPALDFPLVKWPLSIAENFDGAFVGSLPLIVLTLPAKGRGEKSEMPDSGLSISLFPSNSRKKSAEGY
jgi:hypothetical protein